ncbi:hypothetical protein JCM24511_02760 [Saitozyma sp. JCM 24511]|nr:hypothetical protein JCM24511_02760 [Saitozyma sp. JCM 24511]
MVRNSSIPLSDLMASIHHRVVSRSQPLSIPLLHSIIHVHRRSDASSLIALLPYIESTLRSPSASAADVVLILRSLISHLGDHAMIAIMPRVADMFLSSMDTAWARGQGDIPWSEMVHLYHQFLAAFWPFSLWNTIRDVPVVKAGRDNPLPPEISSLVVRCLLDILNKADSAPGSSQPSHRPTLSPAIRKLLLSPAYVTPQIRKIVLQHCRTQRTPIPEYEWHQHMMAAAREGDLDKAASYHQEKLRVRLAIRAAVAAQTPTPASEGQSRTDSPEGEDVIGPDLRSLPEHDVERQQTGDKTTMSVERKPIPADSGWCRRRELLDVVDKMILARSGDSLEHLVQEAESISAFGSTGQIPPSDVDPNGDDVEEGIDTRIVSTRRYAWSALIDRFARGASASAVDIVEIVEAMPQTALVGATVTPAMHALVRRRHPDKAWALWRDLVALEREAGRESRGQWVDRKTLAVATDACADVYNLEGAVALVDLWARNPTIKPDPDGLSQSIVIDAQNVNVLLHQCKLSGRPSIAFRLWAAALPRWGVWLDDISLSLLLDTARFAGDSYDPQNAPDVRVRLRAIAAELNFRKTRGERLDSDTGDWAAYDAAGFAKGGTNVLLDPDDYSWCNEHGREPPWQVARAMFRGIVLGNWPHLSNIKSPLDVTSGAIASISAFFASRQSRSPRKMSENSPSPDPITSLSPSPSRPSPLPFPSTSARHTYIIPTANSFRAYIFLLIHGERYDEIPTALAWMKELGIVPSYNTLSAAILHVSEVQGPRRWVPGWGPDGETRLVSDEDILRRWLLEWLGDGNEEHEGKDKAVIPSENDVAAYRRLMIEKRYGGRYARGPE